MFDIFSELQRQGIRIKQNSSNSAEFSLCCIFCLDMGYEPDTKYRLGFNIESGLGHCFHCGWSSRKAIREIARKLGASGDELSEISFIPFTGQTRTRPEQVTLPEDFLNLADVKSWMPMWPARRYAEKRGITIRQMREHEIGVSEEQKFWGRIIFPVRDRDGVLWGTIARDWTGSSRLRYLNSSGTKGMWNANPDRYSKKIAVISEGIIKSLAIERATYYKICSPATCGNFMTDVQAVQLKGFEEVTMFADPGSAGQTGFLGMAANLHTLFKVTFAWPWPEKQADELESSEIRKLLRQRVRYSPLMEMRVRLERSGFKLPESSGRFQ